MNQHCTVQELGTRNTKTSCFVHFDTNTRTPSRNTKQTRIKSKHDLYNNKQFFIGLYKNFPCQKHQTRKTRNFKTRYKHENRKKHDYTCMILRLYKHTKHENTEFKKIPNSVLYTGINIDSQSFFADKIKIILICNFLQAPAPADGRVRGRAGEV